MKKFKTGDHIKVPGRFGVDHHGIVDNRGRGGTKVIHNAKGIGGIVSSLDEFSDGRSVELVVPVYWLSVNETDGWVDERRG